MALGPGVNLQLNQEQVNALDDAAAPWREEAIKVVSHTMKQHAQSIGNCDGENRPV